MYCVPTTNGFRNRAVMTRIYAVLLHHTQFIQGKSGSDCIHLWTCLWHPVLLNDEFELILATLQATPPVIAMTCPVSEVPLSSAHASHSFLRLMWKSHRFNGCTHPGSSIGSIMKYACRKKFFPLWRSNPFYEYQPTVTSTTSAQWECTNRVLTDCVGRFDFQKRSGFNRTRVQNDPQHTVLLADKQVLYSSLCILSCCLKNDDL